MQYYPHQIEMSQFTTTEKCSSNHLFYVCQPNQAANFEYHRCNNSSFMLHAFVYLRLPPPLDVCHSISAHAWDIWKCLIASRFNNIVDTGHIPFDGVTPVQSPQVVNLFLYRCELSYVQSKQKSNSTMTIKMWLPLLLIYFYSASDVWSHNSHEQNTLLFTCQWNSFAHKSGKFIASSKEKKPTFAIVRWQRSTKFVWNMVIMERFFATFLWTRDSQVWVCDHRWYAIYVCVYGLWNVFANFALFLKISNSVVNQHCWKYRKKTYE